MHSQRFITISFQRSFNLLSTPSGGHLVFESRLHRRNTWIEDFSKEIESGDYSIVLESKHKELYLHILQYKFTLVKHCQLFDFQTWDFVFTTSIMANNLFKQGNKCKWEKHKHGKIQINLWEQIIQTNTFIFIIKHISNTCLCECMTYLAYLTVSQHLWH